MPIRAPQAVISLDEDVVRVDTVSLEQGLYWQKKIVPFGFTRWELVGPTTDLRAAFDWRVAGTGPCGELRCLPARIGSATSSPDGAPAPAQSQAAVPIITGHCFLAGQAIYQGPMTITAEELVFPWQCDSARGRASGTIALQPVLGREFQEPNRPPSGWKLFFTGHLTAPDGSPALRGRRVPIDGKGHATLTSGPVSLGLNIPAGRVEFNQAR